MKKIAKLALIVLVVAVAATAVLAACQDYTWGPVGTTDPEAGNGSVAVAQGNTVYFVNGKGDTSSITEPENNWFGQAGYKGSIMKGTLAADGSVKDVAVVVPKMFYNGQAEGGLYVFGNWIYYTSPSTDTQSDGTVLTSQQDFYRTRRNPDPACNHAGGEYVRIYLDGRSAVLLRYGKFADSQDFLYR